MIVCSYHVRYAFQSESLLYICLNVKELFARNRREFWKLSDCKGNRTHNLRSHRLTFKVKIMTSKIYFYYRNMKYTIRINSTFIVKNKVFCRQNWASHPLWGFSRHGSECTVVLRIISYLICFYNLSSKYFISTKKTFWRSLIFRVKVK